MMKIFFYTILLSVFFAGTAAAFHGTALICNKCHTMHYSEDGGIPPGADVDGPYEYYLIKESTSDVCLTCHDGVSGVPDVLGDDVNGLEERAAGYFNAATPGDNPNGHNLGDKVGSGALCLTCHFGGDFSTAKIGCIDCHEAHGRLPSDPNYRYRNLQWASDPGGEPIITAFVNPSATGLDVYERDNVGYAAPTGGATWREVTNVCLDCHHTFSGDDYTRNPSGHPIRHPVTDSERGALEPISGNPGITDPAHWVSGVGLGFSIDRLPFVVSGATSYADATTVTQDNEVFCLTCHKAHGNGNPSSLRWNYSVDSNLGCQQCHNKGS